MVMTVPAESPRTLDVLRFLASWAESTANPGST
jgi:hypothetical protein